MTANVHQSGIKNKRFGEIPEKNFQDNEILMIDGIPAHEFFKTTSVSATDSLLELMEAPQPEPIKRIREKENTSKMLNIEVLSDALGKKFLHCLELYMLVSRDKRFSGHLVRRKIGMASEILGQRPTTTIRQAEALVDAGLFVKHITQYMSVSSDKYAATSCSTKNVRVVVPEGAKLIDLAYATIISKQVQRIASVEAKKLGKSTRQDIREAVQGAMSQCSSSYTGRYMDTIRVKRHESTIRRRRASASRSGMLAVERTKEVILSGDCEVAMAFEHTEPGTGYYLSTQFYKGKALVTWFSEGAPNVSSMLSFSSRGIPGKLKRLAMETHSLIKKDQCGYKR